MKIGDKVEILGTVIRQLSMEPDRWEIAINSWGTFPQTLVMHESDMVVKTALVKYGDVASEIGKHSAMWAMKEYGLSRSTAFRWKKRRRVEGRNRP